MSFDIETLNLKPNEKVTIYLVTGEPSGDLLGARLMRALTQKYGNKVSFVGVGGESMMKEGLNSLFDIKDLAVMGLAEVIPSIPLVLKRLEQTVQDILQKQPDIVMTIDSFSFSARVHKKLKKLKFDKPHVHCVAPQVWAWKKGRAKKVGQYMDHLFCLLPYEEKYFTPYGMATTFIGHPVIEGGAEKGNGADFKKRYGIDENALVMTMLPGSRKNEVSFLMSLFMNATENLQKTHKNLFVVVPTVATVSEKLKETLKDWAVPHVIVEGEKERYNAFAASDVAMAASGTVSLELALAGVPHLIAYKVSKLTGILAKRLLKIKYVNLINILADREIIPELLQEKCTIENLESTIEQLLRLKTQDVSGSLEKLGKGQDLLPSQKMGEKLLSLIADYKKISCK
ncbi:MAG: lipid-A-disaccharide synthase [Alphaproteobacteria bacterium]|nr:lipid-A-disaccharide synthase [Alphaproteobacteria bacterium]